MNEEQDGTDWRTTATTPSDPPYTSYRAYDGTITKLTLIYTDPQYEPEPIIRTIENAGIRAGEIIGYRAWTLKTDNDSYCYAAGAEGLLLSMVWQHVWAPRNTESVGDDALDVSSGFYAFKTMDAALSEYRMYASCYDDTIVFGEVYMWGEVIEHERGYRAQYAKIKAITRVVEPVDFIWGRLLRLGRYLMGYKSPIEQIRERYGLTK